MGRASPDILMGESTYEPSLLIKRELTFALDNSQKRWLAIKGISAASFAHMASRAVFNISISSGDLWPEVVV
jgi:hypothetical protein